MTLVFAPVLFYFPLHSCCPAVAASVLGLESCRCIFAEFVGRLPARQGASRGRQAFGVNGTKMAGM